MDICRLENVTKIYQDGEAVCPVESVSLAAERGDFIAIEGPSGTGKSTLLFLMAGLLRPTRGRVSIAGKDTTGLSDYELTLLRALNIGFIFQEASLFPALTALENVELAIALRNRRQPLPADRQRAKESLALLGLQGRAHFLPHQLSVGQRRRLGVARALINNPPLILADEPTNDLDTEWAGRVIEILTGAVRAGGALVMVTHHTRWAGSASRRYQLQGGRLVAL